MPYTPGSWLRVLIIQGGIGLAWLVGDPTRTSTRAYEPAVRLGQLFHFGVYPVRTYGLVLIVIAVGLAWSLRTGHPGVWRWSLALACFWTFWTILFAVAAVHSGGLAAPIFAAGFAWYALDHARQPRGRE